MQRLGFKMGDGIVAAVIVTIAVVLFAVLYRPAAVGQAVEITTPTGTTILSLDKDGEYAFSGKDGQTVMLCVANHTAYVRTADCPDKVCVTTGAVSRRGEAIACVPAGIVIRVLGEGEVDAVVS